MEFPGYEWVRRSIDAANAMTDYLVIKELEMLADFNKRTTGRKGLADIPEGFIPVFNKTVLYRCLSDGTAAEFSFYEN